MSVIEFIGPQGKPLSSNIFNHSDEVFLESTVVNISTSSVKFFFLFKFEENYSFSWRSSISIAFISLSQVFWFEAPIVIHLSLVLKA